MPTRKEAAALWARREDKPLEHAARLRGPAWLDQLRELRDLACTDGTGTTFPSDPDGRIRP